MPSFIEKIERYWPAWVAFHGKEAAKSVKRTLGHGASISLGLQAWHCADSQVFVLPSASGSNRDAMRLEGKTGRLEWFREFAALLAGGGANPAALPE